MKVLLVNGSPHKEGCTYTALTEVAGALTREGIDSEIFWLGVKPLIGCIACNKCRETGRCFADDAVNEFLDAAQHVDGFIFGTPVHFAGATGAMTSFMDRVFYAGRSAMSYKPGAAIVSCRRAGSTSTFDQMIKYMTISNMPVVSSQYWNAVHGFTPEDVRQDLEGMQTMRTLGQNMAWMLNCIAAGREAGVTLPKREPQVSTNFIR